MCAHTHTHTHTLTHTHLLARDSPLQWLGFSGGLAAELPVFHPGAAQEGPDEAAGERPQGSPLRRDTGEFTPVSVSGLQ